MTRPLIVALAATIAVATLPATLAAQGVHVHPDSAHVARSHTPQDSAHHAAMHTLHKRLIKELGLDSAQVALLHTMHTQGTPPTEAQLNLMRFIHERMLTLPLDSATRTLIKSFHKDGGLPSHGSRGIHTLLLSGLGALAGFGLYRKFA